MAVIIEPGTHVTRVDGLDGLDTLIKALSLATKDGSQKGMKLDTIMPSTRTEGSGETTKTIDVYTVIYTIFQG